MTLQAMWVHGQSSIADITTDSQGYPLVVPVTSGSTDGMAYQSQIETRTWIHFPIPTPVIHNGVRARLIKVFVLFRSDSKVLLTDIHVWDGPRRIDAFSADPGVSGIHDGEKGLADLVPNVTLWPVDHRPQIYWGLCISACVHFSDAGKITFTTAGADFQV